MRSQPLRTGDVRAVWQQIDHAMARKVEEDGSVGRAAPEGEVVDAEHLHVPSRWQRNPAQGAQDCIAAAAHRSSTQVAQEPTARAPPEQESDQLDELSQPNGAPRIGEHDPGEALRDDGTRACGVVAEEAPHTHSWRRKAISCQGTSRTWRTYREWMRPDTVPHTGHAERVARAWTTAVISVALAWSVTTSSCAGSGRMVGDVEGAMIYLRSCAMIYLRSCAMIYLRS
jgi:hypothetical protein